MNFDFSEEQEQLRNSLRALLDDRYTFEGRRKTIRTAPGFSHEAWASFAELGLLGLSLPERAGGLALDAVSTLVVLEEFGRALVVEPYLETVVLCGGLLARAGSARADRLLADVAAGRAMLAFAADEPHCRYDATRILTAARRDGSGWRLDGAKSVVSAAPWANHLLVTAKTSDREGLSLFVVDPNARGVKVVSYPTIDGRRAADIEFRAVHLDADALIGAEGGALPNIERALDDGIAAVGAEALGVLAQLLEDCLSYSKQRRQFGQPLAKFQVLQHRMVDMYIELELARSAVYLATLKLPAPPRERSLAASVAKVAVGKACRLIGQGAVQLHGGMGMTDELTISHHFKRATAIELEFGTADFHLARHSALTRAEA